MTNIEKFGLISGVIGLIADIIALSSLALGLVTPLPQLGFWSNLEVIGILTLTLVIYSVAICLVFLFQLARNRWELVGQAPRYKDFEKGTLILGYTLWLPPTIIWSFAMFQLLNNALAPSQFVNKDNLGVVVLFVVAGGGYVITKLSVGLNIFFSP